ncbi:hypothetical protein CANCADRAFT_2611 [Tortispora caseinolytica NRRL Y-17796]|uniref:Major facilitator superfamily (MFS) profile domain-containing protein n=1 Tax=Tortispora caseinolytica NRRL Y-17796 TaxID=767744 RepID=A0A1E4TGL4_9ASCO|nr:hypothetical protein CANCADRAFT_2611 [Tortispora caseinolytica NRRL Y-17796]
MAGINRTAGGNAAFHNTVNDFAHISDPIERRRLALEKIDNAKFGWYHVRAITVAGVGFFTDAYDIFAINIAVVMMAYSFYHSASLPSSTDTAIKVSTSGGTVIGQLFFGWIADVLGRKRVYGIELMIIIAGTLGQAIAGKADGLSFVGVIIFWRVIMGIGIGGDYPLSSIITSEFATTRFRGAMMGAVFANQGWGQLAAAIVGVVCTAGWKGVLEKYDTAAECVGECAKATDQMWRIVIGFGAVPACFALYFRLTMPETPRYTFDVSHDVDKADADIKKYLANKYGDATAEEIAAQIEASVGSGEDAVVRLKSPTGEDLEVVAPKASLSDFYNHFKQWKHGRLIIGTAGSWFFLDVAFYGLGLNNSTILAAIGYAGQHNVYTNLHNVCVGNIILVCAGAIPGYWLSVATIDTVGRKPLQTIGFLMLTILFCIIGFAYHKLGDGGLLALYVLCQLFFNWGPNTTTFIVPGETYPTRYRSTAHGISAASGKVGAIIAQVLIGPLKGHGCPASNNACWLNHVMEIFALFMLLGVFTSLCIVETKRRTLEEICETVHGEADPTRRPAGQEKGDIEGQEAV